VDDSSFDDSGRCAAELGAQLLVQAGGPRGPAWARTRGAEVATGDVLVFFDADVMVHADTVALLERYLTQAPEIAAVFGSYDLHPTGLSRVSRFKNLMHHYVHQHAQREAFTFWAGCGAVRRPVFEQLGGFDERYVHPSIEDIDLGARLCDAGLRVWLCADVQVTHLKEWTFLSLLRADIRDRAVPWSRLLLERGELPNGLNVDTASRQSALAAWAGLVSFALGLWLPWFWFVTLAAMLALILLNRSLYRFFIRQGGIVLALVAVGLHTLYLLYSSAVFGSMMILNQVNGRRVDKSR
jgi:GT2 family glycosyltransferase